MSFAKRSTRGTQRSPWRNLWSSSARTQALGSTSKTWLLLAKDDHRCHRLCKTVPRLSNPWWFHTSSTWASSPDDSILAVWNVGHWCYWTNQSTDIQRTSVHPSNNRLLLQIGWSHPFERSKGSWCDQVHQIPYHLPLWHPKTNVHDNGPQFVSQPFQRFCNKFRIQSVSSTTYYPPTNCLA